MGVDRLRPAHRADDRQLAEGVVEMVVAADHVGDAHVVIVDDDREHVGRRSVRAEQDEIVELGILDGDPALDAVVDDGLALARRLQADDEGLVRRRRSGAQSRHGLSMRNGRRSACGLLALRGELLLGHVAAIGCAALEQPVGDFGVARPRIATGNIRARPNRGRASASRRGSRRSPPGSSAPCRCPRSAAGTCRRGGARTAS